MPLVVSVPPNTMLADLDETLRALLRRELGRHGFDGVEIAFDAPAREWSGQLSGPTVNLFLYDLREAAELRPVEWRAEQGNGGPRELRPPLIMECTYAITAWTQEVEDEHRLLSQVLGVLYAFPELPEDAMPSRLASTLHRYPVEGRVGAPRAEGKADFWVAVGGQYKASVDYVVHLACESGVVFERGPEVRTQTISVRQLDAGPSAVLEMHRCGGEVLDGDGAPVADAWVTLPQLGRWVATDDAGRWELARVPAGEHEVVARGPDGTEGQGSMRVPGPAAAVTVGPAKRRPRQRRS